MPPERQDVNTWSDRLRRLGGRTEVWEGLLFWLFALSIVLFPFGQAFRVVPPLVCLAPLLVLYVTDWPNRTLRNLPVWWLWVVFFVVIVLEVLGSSWMSVSWNVVRPNLFRGFLLAFIAMECVREERDLRRLVGAFALAAVLEGLNGVWQFATGADLVTGTSPLKYIGTQPFVPGSFESLKTSRLTGSMSTYRVGNFMALMLLPASALFVLWPRRRWTGHVISRMALTACVLAPALFLWLGSQTRSGYMALAGGLYLAWLMLARPTKWFAVPPLLIILVLLFGPDRVSLSAALADDRMHIWSLAWDCFLRHPLLGTGAGTFEVASKALGVTLLPSGEAVPPHPHNVYMQWLVDGGIVGFLGFSLWAFGLAAWSGRRIWMSLHRPSPEEAANATYWRLAAFFWAGWMGYLINALAAHDFYRTWWVSASFSIVGILLGACAYRMPPAARGSAPGPRWGKSLPPDPLNKGLFQNCHAPKRGCHVLFYSENVGGRGYRGGCS